MWASSMLNKIFPLWCFSAAEWSHLPPEHPPGPAGKTPGAPTDAFCAVPQAAPRLRQMQRKLRRDGPYTSRGETQWN